LNELNVQIADLPAPFPAKIFEKELLENGIRFREMSKTNGDGGFPSVVYFVCSEDVERVTLIREKIDRENAKSEENYRHPSRKILAYLGLFLIVIFLGYKLVEAFS